MLWYVQAAVQRFETLAGRSAMVSLQPVSANVRIIGSDEAADLLS